MSLRRWSICFLLLLPCLLGCGPNETDPASEEALARSVRQLNVLFQEVEENVVMEQQLTPIRVARYYDDYIRRAQAVRAQLAETVLAPRYAEAQARLDSVVVRTVALLQYRSGQMTAALDASAAYRAFKVAVSNADRSYYTGNSFIAEAVAQEQALHEAVARARAGRTEHQPVAEALHADAVVLNAHLNTFGLADSLAVKGVTRWPEFLVSFFAEVEAFQPEYGRYRTRADELKAQLTASAGV